MYQHPKQKKHINEGTYMTTQINPQWLDRLKAAGISRAEQRRIETEFIDELLQQGYNKSEIARICQHSITWVTTRMKGLVRQLLERS